MLGQGCTFTFNNTTYSVTSVLVRSPVPEVVDMTPANAGRGEVHMVATGEFISPGVIEVDAFGFQSDPKGLVGTAGALVFQGAASVVVPRAICSEASSEAKVGDLLRMRMTFTITDNQG